MLMLLVWGTTLGETLPYIMAGYAPKRFFDFYNLVMSFDHFSVLVEG